MYDFFGNLLINYLKSIFLVNSKQNLK